MFSFRAEYSTIFEICQAIFVLGEMSEQIFEQIFLIIRTSILGQRRLRG